MNAPWHYEIDSETGIYRQCNCNKGRDHTSEGFVDWSDGSEDLA